MANSDSSANVNDESVDQSASASPASSPRGSSTSNGATENTGAAPGNDADLGSTAAQAADQVQQTVSGLRAQFQHQATDQLTLQKERAAGGLELMTQVLHQASQQVREQDQAPLATSIEGVAQRVEHWTETLRATDVEQLVDETKQLAGRQPALFVGGALALGFVGVRFLRSSAQQDAADQAAPASGNPDKRSKPNTRNTRRNDAAASSEPAAATLHDLAELEQVLPPSKQPTANSEP